MTFGFLWEAEIPGVPEISASEKDCVIAPSVYSRMASTPGSVPNSMYSSRAPPPVEM